MANSCPIFVSWTPTVFFYCNVKSNHLFALWRANLWIMHIYTLWMSNLMNSGPCFQMMNSYPYPWLWLTSYPYDQWSLCAYELWTFHMVEMNVIEYLLLWYCPILGLTMWKVYYLHFSFCPFLTQFVRMFARTPPPPPRHRLIHHFIAIDFYIRLYRFDSWSNDL